MRPLEVITPQWPAPASVRALTTTRAGGVSAGRYASLNLALHTGDLPRHVHQNRRLLRSMTGVSSTFWLEQVHGTDWVDAGAATEATPRADAAYCQRVGRACAILSADCLPVLICDRGASLVAAAHCGWRGLADGVLKSLIAALPAAPDQLLAWLGPAIGPARYEVGSDVRDAVCSAAQINDYGAAFRPGNGDGKWWLDLYALARRQLAELGIVEVHGGGLCTYDDARFYSYRRDGVTGRIASLIWLA